MTSELEGSWEEDSPSELDFSAGKKESFIVDVRGRRGEIHCSRRVVLFPDPP